MRKIICVAALLPFTVATLTALTLAQANDTSAYNQRDIATTAAKKQPARNIDRTARVIQQSTEFTLTLGETTFDPGIAVPLPPVGWRDSSNDPHGRNIHLIQFTGPIQEQWLETLAAANVEIIQYIHPYTYIVWSNQAGVDFASALPAARWAGDFHPAYRVLPMYRNLGDAPADVRIMLYRGADCDAAIASIQQLGAQLIQRSVMDRTFEVVRFTINGNGIQTAAKVPGVYSVKPVPTDGGSRGEMTAQISADNVDGTNRAFPGYQSWLAGLGLSGAGIIIANVDEGVRQQHPDLINRMLPCVGSTCSTTSSSHGTHTAGIMAGDGSSGVVDSNGFLRGLGIAPGAHLIEQNYQLVSFTPDGMQQLIKDSYNNGAHLSGNSWGPAGSPRGYDDDTRAVDVSVRDANADIAGNQSFTYVLAFMNGYGGTSSQGTPDEGKNMFTIGSTKGQTSSGAQYLAVNDLSVNSAHGPALDGRMIPHMVAPGCYVDSTVPNVGYQRQCGTSMACPAVAGGAALFMEYYRGLPNYTIDPSPAMIKAAFLPVAHDLAGSLDASGNVMGHPFDSKQGWGRMNLNAVLNNPPGTVMYFDNPMTFDATGEQWSVDVAAADSNAPMRIMLVWTDAPGHGLGGSTPAWNNDLNLVVEAGGSYNGNAFGPDGYSVIGGAADNKNNTEGVFLLAPGPNTITIRVNAANINSDGIPDVGDGSDQDFALVCYNCTTPVIPICPGDIAEPADNVVDVFDLFVLLGAWNTSGGGADLAEPNNIVDVFDLFVILKNWGPCK